MATAKQGDTVQVHYTGKLNDGAVFDSSTDSDPVEFTIGEGDLIPGFEEAVVGMTPGESKVVTVPSEMAYGPYFEEMVQQVDRSAIPTDIELAVGKQLYVQHPQAEDETLMLTIIDLNNETVTLDGNHPLADKDLDFEIQLVAIV